MWSSGDVVSLTDCIFGHKVSLVLEVVGKGFLAAELSKPYDRLHLMAKEVVFKSASPNKDNLLVFEAEKKGYEGEGNNKGIVLLAALQTQGKGSAEKARHCLGLTSDGLLVSLSLDIDSVCSETPRTMHTLTHGTVSIWFSLNGEAKRPRELSLSTRTRLVSPWQWRRFFTEGYLHIPQCLSAERMHNTLAYLLHNLGLVDNMVAGGIQGNEFIKFSGSVSNSDTVRAVLLSSKIGDIVRELFGGREIFQSKSVAAQIAFRFPQFREQSSGSDSEGDEEKIEWHTDGYRQGHSHSFSVLLGVSLSAVNNDFEGNLSVWPGSHFLLHRCRRGVHGGLDIRELCSLTEREEKFSAFFHPTQKTFREQLELKESLQPSEERHNNSSTVLPCLGKPVQLRTQPGDIVLLHPDLAHGGAPNYSHSIRQMMYFRLKIQHGSESSEFPDWDTVVRRQCDDMWVDLPGITHTLGQRETQQLTTLYRD